MSRRILAIIPARGGSRGIPGKNLTPLGGKPLLVHTCEAARQSRHLSRVVLSTDDPAIADVGRAAGVEAPFVRPAELSADETPMLPVMRHVVEWLSVNEGWEADVVVLLQPTSPLRRAEDIDGAIEVLDRTGADTVVSVVEVPHRFHPYSVMKLEEGWLKEFWEDEVPVDRYRRQSLPPLYARNGPAVLVVRAHRLRAAERLYLGRVAPYVMTPERSVDIDGPLDLAVAEFLLSRRRFGEP